MTDIDINPAPGDVSVAFLVPDDIVFSVDLVPFAITVAAPVPTDIALSVDLVAIRVNVAAPLPTIPLLFALPAVRVNVAAPTYTSITLGAPSQSITPVGLLVQMKPVDPTLSAGPIAITLNPISVQVGGVGYYVPILGTVLQGDPFTYPWEISNAGSSSYVMNSMTTESGEPTTAFTKTMWLRYWAPGPMTLTLTASGGTFATQVFAGSTLASLVQVATGTTSVSVDLNTGYSYIRLATSANITIALAWAFVVRPLSLLQKALTPVLTNTPSTLRVAVQGVQGREDVAFVWSPPVSDLIGASVPRPIAITSIRADEDGRILVGSLQIPAVHAGSYEVVATGASSGATIRIPFAVSGEPFAGVLAPEE